MSRRVNVGDRNVEVIIGKGMQAHLTEVVFPKMRFTQYGDFLKVLEREVRKLFQSEQCEVSDPKMWVLRYAGYEEENVKPTENQRTLPIERGIFGDQMVFYTNF